MLTLDEALESSARRYPQKNALIWGDQSVTFSELNTAVNRAANALRSLGVKEGDTVAFLLPNGIPAAELLLACARLGCIVVPVNLRLAPPEIAFVLAHCESSVLIADSEILSAFGSNIKPPGRSTILSVGPPIQGIPEWDKLKAAAPGDRPGPPRKDDDPWLLVYTSGTTGQPKGAVRNQRSDLMIALLLAAEFGISSDDRGLAILPMFHVNSIWFVCLSLAIGATCVLYPHRVFNPVHIIEEIARHDVTYSMFVPTLLSFLADSAERGRIDREQLRVILTSSAPLSPTLRDRLIDDFPKARLYDIYGATELGAVTSVRHVKGGPSGTVGHPALTQDVRLFDDDFREVAPFEVGELYCKGPTLMERYFKNDDATRLAFRDGYLTVGDMGYRDEAGLIHLVDRKSDMIITSGENVYPSEVENVLYRHPNVAVAAVVGLADERRGESIVAVVQPKEGTQVDKEELLRLANEHLADYKRPKTYLVAEALPLGPTGKVLRRKVREMIASGAL